jgi:predicted esterase
MHPYEHARKEARFDLIPGEGSARWLYDEVSFPSDKHNRYQEDDIARAEYYRPTSGERFPLVMLIHGLGVVDDRDVVPCRLLARDMVRKGIAAMVFKLIPTGEDGQSGVTRIDNWLELCQTVTINIRQIMNWAEERPELDASRIAILGISMGSNSAVAAMAVDHRVKAGIFIIAGGNMELAIWQSRSALAQVSHQCTRGKCHEIYSHYPQYLADVAEKGVGNVTPARDCFLFDSLTFAPQLRDRPLLMINADNDDFIPRESTMQLWHALGEPRLVWLPAQHTSIFRHYHAIRKEVIGFLESTFNI